MKVGNLVRNVFAVRTNPVVNDSKGWHPIEPGHTGIVVEVRKTKLNADWNKDGKGDVYVDVHLSVDGKTVRCGNYLANTFEVIA